MLQQDQALLTLNLVVLTFWCLFESFENGVGGYEIVLLLLGNFERLCTSSEDIGDGEHGS